MLRLSCGPIGSWKTATGGTLSKTPFRKAGSATAAIVAVCYRVAPRHRLPTNLCDIPTSGISVSDWFEANLKIGLKTENENDLGHPSKIG